MALFRGWSFFEDTRLGWPPRRGGSGLGLFLRLLGQQDGLAVGQDASLSNGDAIEQLVLVAVGLLKGARNDTGLLVAVSGVPGEREGERESEIVRSVFSLITPLSILLSEYWGTNYN